MLRVFSRLTDGAAAGCGGEGMSLLSTVTPALVESHQSSRALASVMTRFRSSPPVMFSGHVQPGGDPVADPGHS